MRNRSRILSSATGALLIASGLWWARGESLLDPERHANALGADVTAPAEPTDSAVRSDATATARAERVTDPAGAELGEVPVPSLAAAAIRDETNDVPRRPVLWEVPPGSGHEPPGPPPIELDPLEAGEVTARVRGFDPEAPRALLLWRHVGERSAVMARGHSREDGQLVFPELVIPDGGLEVVVTDALELPGDPSTSLPRQLAARPLAPPQATLLEVDDGFALLRIVPAEASGQVLLATPDGQIFGRHAIPVGPNAAHRFFDLELTLLREDTLVWLAHERADGRRSDWWPLALTPGEAP